MQRSGILRAIHFIPITSYGYNLDLFTSCEVFLGGKFAAIFIIENLECNKYLRNMLTEAQKMNYVEAKSTEIFMIWLKPDISDSRANTACMRSVKEK